MEPAVPAPTIPTPWVEFLSVYPAVTSPTASLATQMGLVRTVSKTTLSSSTTTHAATLVLTLLQIALFVNMVNVYNATKGTLTIFP